MPAFAFKRWHFFWSRRKKERYSFCVNLRRVYSKTSLLPLGEIYEINSMIGKANDSYLKSLRFENDGSVFYNLGLINDFKMAHKQTAVKYYKLYLATKPNPVKNKEVIDCAKLRIATIKAVK